LAAYQKFNAPGWCIFFNKIIAWCNGIKKPLVNLSIKNIKNLSVMPLIATALGKKDKMQMINAICTTATIKYGGNTTAGGVGWYISVPGTAAVKSEYPENLPDTFKVDGLLVDVCYVKTGKDFVCFCLPPLPKMVSIVSIIKH
jgi:hypothetical protein